jgi:prophage antirepressor-like protein
VYRLIIKSTLPKAQAFERWVMEDVLPTLRKKGFYAMHHQQKSDFIDARDVPFYAKPINGYNVRCIEVENAVWVVINDANKAIHSSTSSNQLAKKLNIKQILAKKIWLFGNTHPAWCTNELGLQLLLAGSRKFSNQLNLAL